MQKRGWLYYFASLLIILGVVGHEVIPHHHHHHTASESATSHQTCSNHNHSDSNCADNGNGEKDQACSIFEYNPLGNVRLNTIDFSKKIECKNLSLFVLNTDLSATFFVPRQHTAFRLLFILKKPLPFFESLSRRGPPVL